MHGQNVKKTALWGVPMFLLLAGLGVWVSIGDVIPTLRDIVYRAPSLRIRSLSMLMPLFALFCLLAASLFPLRILQLERAASVIEKVWIGLMATILLSIPIVSSGGAWLQRHYLPPLGYHYCDKLNGNPTVWFNDWVKNPAWCVYGKDHRWVRAQENR